ncbi:MAG: hypothetical protein ABIT71_20890 [Vicinamibacteraceae bacterium]
MLGTPGITPPFAGTLFAVLAVSVAVTTAMFSVLYGVPRADG